MISHPRQPAKTAGVLGGVGLLALVGYADFSTGYQFTLLVFYLLPILCVLRYAGVGFACGMAGLASLVWLFADYAAGNRYPNFYAPIWNACISLAVFLLVIVLFHGREHVRVLVAERTESLREEIRERTRLETELLTIVETEQRRIAHDLHDSLGQHLTATAMAGKIIAKRIAAQSTVEPAMADRVVAMLEEAIELTRNLARLLHPISMEAEGLKEALQNLAVSLSKAFNVACRFQSAGDAFLSDPKADVQLYRIAQEAAGNAIRHGHARQITISLDATPAGLTLMVTDDGLGFSTTARQQKGMGLRIMAYRANLIGASFEIQNLPGGGAQAVCILKSRPNEHENFAAKN